MSEHDAPIPHLSRTHNRIDGAHGSVVQAGVIHGDVHVRSAVSPRQPPRQLPLPGGSLLGRADELARLDASLPHDGVAVITGMAGIGKTALAVHWAHRASARFPDGQLYVDLQGFGPAEPLDAHDVLAGFLRALGHAQPDEITSTAERAAAFRSLSADRRLLVVLDNVRRVTQIRPLLPGGRDCAVVITSRTSLPGLAVHNPVVAFQLHRLSEADGLSLLGEALGGHPAAVQENAYALARYCAGLPLALRIAGTLVAESGPGDLGHFGEPLATGPSLTFLDAGEDDVSALRTVFSWSYRVLSEKESLAFRVLGAHPGPGIDRHALIAATEATADETGSALRALVRGHLVTETGPGLFGTHDLLREYARELCAPERELMMNRLYDFYTDVADRADDIVSPMRFRLPRPRPPRPEPLLPDLPAALSWLDATLPTLVALCTTGGEQHDDQRWRLAYALRGYFYFTKRLDAWAATHDAALQATLRLRDVQAEALTRSNLGMALVFTGRLAEAEAQHRSAHELFTQLGDEHGRAGALANLASVLRRRGALGEALSNQQRALAFYRRSDAGRHICITLRSMASVETDLHRFTDALAHLKEAIDISRRLRLHLEAAQALNSLGIMCLRMGEASRALEAHSEAADHSRSAGSVHQEATSHRKLGRAALTTGDRARAASCWALAVRLFHEIGSEEAESVASDLASLCGAEEPE
jgi:tetratricopeptide (TPR) repeat protein